MNFAAIDWLSISINLLLVIFVIVCLLMTLLILMQRPKQEGLGAAFGGGVTDQVFGARTTNVLQRGTVYLGSLFFLLSLTLAVLIGHQNKKTSMLAAKEPVVEKKSEAGKPAEETKPKSLAEELPADSTPPAPPVVAPAPETPAPQAEVPAPAPEAAAPAAEAPPAAESAAPAAEVPPAPVAPESAAPPAEDKSGQP
jgi:preprotein translocase subunit SecG